MPSGPPTTLTSDVEPEALPLAGLAGAPVFWGQSSGIARYEGSVQQIVSDPDLGPLSLAVTGDHLYYSSYYDQSVTRVTHEGDLPVTLGDMEENVANVTVGHGAVYWTRLNTVVRAYDP